MERLFFGFAALLGLLGVALGAFGSHLLMDQVENQRVFEIAVRYQMFHALALMGVCWLHSRTPTVFSRIAGWLFFAGVIVFSGSLYLLALTGAPALGMVTPFGGTALLGGWFCLLIAALLQVEPEN